MSLNERPISKLVDFEEVCRRLKEQFPAIPEDAFFNRLKNIGVEELLADSVFKYGFPFKYFTHDDESTMALAYFLDRFRIEGGTLNVYGIHVLQKGEDKTLASWMNEEAKLYLEIQNIILLLGKVQERKSRIKRIFVFRDVSDLAFLNETAVNVINEQRALGVEIGFVFANELVGREPEVDFLTTSLIIEFNPPNVKAGAENVPNFYVLYDELRSNQIYKLPYQQKCYVKWYSEHPTLNAPGQSAHENEIIKHVTNVKLLFDGKWEDFSRDSKQPVHALPVIGEADFNSSLYTMYVAYLRAKQKGLTSSAEQMFRRFNEKVVTADLVRLEKAARAFDNERVEIIKAVDPSSVKNTLKLHESEPLYRNWLRKGLNRLVQENSKVKLERIYIFDDTKKPNQVATEEYNSLLRNMQYYLDYFNYEISELKDVTTNHRPNETPSRRTNWEKKLWNSLKNRVKIYVTTKSAVEENWKKLPQKTQDTVERLLEEFASDMDGLNSSPYENLVKLDFLFAEVFNKVTPSESGEACSVIYKFDNPRADPGELEFTASLMREEFNANVEEKKLFNFLTQADEDMAILLREQRLRRAWLMLNSIGEYRISYGSVSGLKKIFEAAEQKLGGADGIDVRIRNWITHSEKHGINCQTLKKELESGVFKEYCKVIIQVRRDIETGLYRYFADRAEYLFDLLQKLSVEVRFFDTPNHEARPSALQRRERDGLHPNAWRKFWNKLRVSILSPIFTHARQETQSDEKTNSVKQIFPFVTVEHRQLTSDKNAGLDLGEVIKDELNYNIPDGDREREEYFATFVEPNYPDNFLKI